MRKLALLLMLVAVMPAMAQRRGPVFRMPRSTTIYRPFPRVQRSPTVRAAFQRMSPCPAIGATSGGCSGYVVDHIRPLALGGPDAVNNMQWQTVEAGRAKDREEMREYWKQAKLFNGTRPRRVGRKQ